MEYTIFKKGRRGFIRPFPSSNISNRLDSMLSYEKQGIEFMPIKRWGIVKLYRMNTASFPWGLLSNVIKCLNGYSIKIKLLKRDRPTIDMDPKLRGYQRLAIMKLIDNYGGILCMPTGSGKTFTCLDFLKHYKQKTLVICPTRYLVEQWKEQSPKYVDVRTYQGIKDYSILDKYKIVVFDECHHVAASTLYKLAMKLKEQIVVGLSATPYREDGEDMKMHGALGEIVYEVELRELIDDGFLSEAEVKWIALTHIDEDIEYKTYQEIYKERIVFHSERNSNIIECCKHYKDKKILILVGEIEHGMMLYDDLDGEDAIFLNSKSKVKDYDHRIIIATSILDEGIDLPDREVIIMATGGKSSIKVLQRIGRVLRKHESKECAIIVDFIDNSKYLYDHYKKRSEIYKKHGFKNRRKF
jgi:superfamily II DNA or RNA helicase